MLCVLVMIVSVPALDLAALAEKKTSFPGEKGLRDERHRGRVPPKRYDDVRALQREG